MELEKIKEAVHPHETQSLWKNTNYIILFLSSTVLAFGNKIYALTLPLTLYKLTKSSVAMSTMRGIEFLPNLCLALFIGVLVDRVNKKRWSLWSIFVQIIILLTLYLLTDHHVIHVWIYYISGFFLMTFGYAYSNAQAGLVKQVLPSHLLTSANVSLNFIMTLIGIMGPTLTGVILMLSNVYDGLLFTAAAFILSFVVMNFLKFEVQKPPQRQTGAFFSELKEGWIELRRNRPLWMMTLMVIFFNSTAGMVDTTVVFYAKESLHLKDALLGLAFSMAGVGGLVGSLIVNPAKKVYTNGVIITVNTLFIGISYSIIFFFKNVYGLSIGMFLEGVFSIIASICIWSYRQESTPHHLIGRVTGLTGSIFKLGMPFAIFFAGWLIKWFNPSFIFLLCCLINVLLFLACRFSHFWDHQKPNLLED